MAESEFYIGVDGCRAGWISISSVNEFQWKIELYKTITELWEANSEANLILIDIPIGLRENGDAPRLNDVAARKYLTGKRSSGIFPTPCRKAAYAPTYEMANQINKKLTGKGLSKQSWNITSKIREIDLLLQENEKSRQVFIESGPELCYCALNSNKPMEFYKKTKDGIDERLRILKNFCKSNNTPLDIGLNNFKRKEVAVDDIMDAWILAISASRGKSNLLFIPENYEFDSTGLPMRIALPNFQ